MADFQASDLTGVDAAYVLQELDHLVLELKLSRWRFGRGAILRSEFHATHSGGPGIEQQFTMFNPQELEAAKTELLHRDDEGALTGQ